MKVGDLVQRNHYDLERTYVGIIIRPALSLTSEWWIVEWAHAFTDGRRETIRSEHLKLVS